MDDRVDCSPNSLPPILIKPLIMKMSWRSFIALQQTSTFVTKFIEDNMPEFRLKINRKAICSVVENDVIVYDCETGYLHINSYSLCCLQEITIAGNCLCESEACTLIESLKNAKVRCELLVLPCAVVSGIKFQELIDVIRPKKLDIKATEYCIFLPKVRALQCVKSKIVFTDFSLIAQFFSRFHLIDLQITTVITSIKHFESLIQMVSVASKNSTTNFLISGWAKEEAVIEIIPKNTAMDSANRVGKNYHFDFSKDLRLLIESTKYAPTFYTFLLKKID